MEWICPNLHDKIFLLIHPIERKCTPFCRVLSSPQVSSVGQFTKVGLFSFTLSPPGSQFTKPYQTCTKPELRHGRRNWGHRKGHKNKIDELRFANSCERKEKRMSTLSILLFIRTNRKVFLPLLFSLAICWLSPENSLLYLWIFSLFPFSSQWTLYTSRSWSRLGIVQHLHNKTQCHFRVGV